MSAMEEFDDLEDVDDLEEFIVEEERGKGRVILALILAIILPPIGLILAVYELLKYRRHPSIRNLAIMAIIFSIIAMGVYIYGYMHYSTFHVNVHNNSENHIN